MGSSTSKLWTIRGGGGQNKKEGPGALPAAPEKVHQPGEGIRSMKTSQAFRALNFELYAKPNKTIMGLGLACLTMSLTYLVYMRYNYDSKQFYEAVAEDGTVILRPKKSRWDS